MPRDPDGSTEHGNQRQKQLYKHDWVVYAKTPMGGPAEVLSYLARYTHRTAISNERILRIDEHQVTLRVRADANGGKRIVKMPGTEFIGRFLRHVLPTGIKRIRHYGLLSPAAKRHKLTQARAALQMPPANPVAAESAQAFMQRVSQQDILQCPCCRHGRLRVVEVFLASTRLPDPRRPAQAATPACRGPP